MRMPKCLPQPNEKQVAEIKMLSGLAFGGFAEEYDAAVEAFNANEENKGFERTKYANLPFFMKKIA